MKLYKFRIRNYKSIIDSEYCYLEDRITILAGKNESGKTAILEALEDFNVGKNIREEAKPIGMEGEFNAKIAVNFKISKDTLNEIFEKAGIDHKNDKECQITIIKAYPDHYELDQNSINILGLTKKDDQGVKKQIEDLYENLKYANEKHPELSTNIPSLDLEKISDFVKQFSNFSKEVKVNLSVIPDEVERNYILEIISKIVDLTEVIQNVKDPIQSFLKVFKESYIPNFVLYSSFEDEFPHEIPIKDLEQNNWAKELTKVSSFSPKIILEGQKRTKKEHKEKLKVDLQGVFEKFWNQNPIFLEIDWDSINVSFWIVDKNRYFEPKQRSKGQQWHIAFYIRVGARVREDIKNVILIDEPGLFLHAKAQKDVLLILEELSEEAQIVFSTHSPYLIEHEKLERIRLIIKEEHNGNDEEESTKIIKEIHSMADKETLTPILTAIGLGLNDAIQDIDRKNNAVVEGPSDTFYLQAFKKIVEKGENDSESPNFVFGGGSGNMSIVGTVLQGWGCNVIYLYDNDQGKKDGKRNLMKKWYVLEKFIISVLEVKDRTIEDIFSKNDFIKYVLESNAEETKYEVSNSEYIKQKGINKVVLARTFRRKVDNKEEIELDNETMNNIINLFERINKIFSSEKSEVQDDIKQDTPVVSSS